MQQQSTNHLTQKRHFTGILSSNNQPIQPKLLSNATIILNSLSSQCHDCNFPSILGKFLLGNVNNLCMIFYSFFLSLAVSTGCKSFLALTHMTQGIPLCFLPGEKHQRGQYPLVHSAGVVNGVGDCDCISDWECIAGLVLLVRQKKPLLQLQGMHDFCCIHFGLLLASLMSSQSCQMPMSIN
jgi:hypothetical protein